METIKGLLTDIEVKTGQGKKGPWTMYTFVVDGKKYGCFEKELRSKVNIGDNVILYGEKNGEYWNLKDIEKDSTGNDGGVELGDYSLKIKSCELAIEFAKVMKKDLMDDSIFNIANAFYAYITNSPQTGSEAQS